MTDIKTRPATIPTAKIISSKSKQTATCYYSHYFRMSASDFRYEEKAKGGEKARSMKKKEKISFASWWSVWRMVVIDLMPPIDYACQKFTYYSSSLLLAKPSSSTASTRWRCWQPLLFVQKVFFWHNLWYITKATPLICATGENASLWNDMPKVWKGETKAFNYKSLLLEDIKVCIESQMLCFAFAVGK